MMRELSIFVDESGDFGETDQISPYYLVSLVFHDQTNKIESNLAELENKLRLYGHENQLIHAGPIIRREREFHSLNVDNRRKIFYAMLSFYKHLPIKHTTIIVNKKDIDDIYQLNSKLSRQIHSFIQSHLDTFQSFDKVIVYYDNGQYQLNIILNTILSAVLNDVEFRKATPNQYRLLQVADFVCTLELLNIKRNEKRLSKSEQSFFYKSNELKKTFLKAIEEKKI